MVKDIKVLKEKPMQSETIKNWAMKIMSFIFERSQDNLLRSMPWGDSDSPNTERKKDTMISDIGMLMRSGVPPHIEGNKITMEYTAVHAMDVEFGSDPKKVKVSILAQWAIRKLGMKKSIAWSFAKRLSKKIEREGILPHPFLRPSLSDAVAKFNLNIKPPRL